jgi:tetratricopeptide (TPR) repeat protein
VSAPTLILFLLGLQLAIFAQPDPNLTVRGEIVQSSPITAHDLMIELFDQSTHLVVERAFVGGDGSFEFHQLHPGSYEVRVFNGRSDLLHSEYASIGQGAGGLTIRLPDAPNAKPGGMVALATLAHRVDRKAAKELAKAQRDFLRGDVEGAILEAKKALDRDPAFAAAHNQLGGYYVALRRPEDALTEFQRTVDLDPGLPIGHSNLSILLLALNRPAEAEVQARRAIQLNPGLGKAHYILGISLLRQRKFTIEALDQLREASADFPPARQIAAELEQRLAGDGALPKKKLN